MGRWEPHSRRRLEEAALALYARDGFEKTTAAQIAERAGLTERTFFRHFGDKREVLFSNEGAVRELLVTAVRNAPEAHAPRDAIAAGLQAVGGELQPRREAQRRRAALIAAHPELQERELIKQASWSAALADTLQARGVAEPAARLTAKVAIAIVRVAFERWIDEANDRDLPHLIAEALDQIELFASRE
ncbi:MAG: transcriptional regulator, TetR family [Solirubrobacterales bacterium]|nr:transcriptional regulator, TetR family [Solirubrobacterales bacterium]